MFQTKSLPGKSDYGHKYRSDRDRLVCFEQSGECHMTLVLWKVDFILNLSRQHGGSVEFISTAN